MNDKIHFDDFAEQVALETGYDLESAKTYIYAMFESIIEANEKGEMVKVRNFGSFKPVFNKARRVVNPQTGTPMDVSAHYHIHFSPSQTLSAIANAPYSHLHATRISEVKSNNWLYGVIAGVLLVGGIAAYLILGGEEKPVASEPVMMEEPAAVEEPVAEEPVAPVVSEPEAEEAAPQAMVDEVLEEGAPEPEVHEQAAAQTPRYPGGKYRVNKSDTLYNISDILYSNAHFWPAIFSKNEEGIEDPDLIFPGTPLRIPARPNVSDSGELANLEASYISAYKRYKAIGKADKAMWLLYTGCIKFDKGFIEGKGIDPEDKRRVKVLLKRFDP